MSEFKGPEAVYQKLCATQWGQRLEAGFLERIVGDVIVKKVPAQGFVVTKGTPVDHWVGVLDGLVKIATMSFEGKSVTFTGVPAGGWFGEGSLLKDHPYLYDVVALRDSVVAYLPKKTFHWLLDNSIAFNRFLLVQINERLGQFIGAVEYDRLLETDARVARSIAGLYNPILYPGSQAQLQISQEELSFLVGTSRQRVNQALQALEKEGLVKVDYGCVKVLDVDGLKRYGA